jgi:hypothetical protein
MSTFVTFRLFNAVEPAKELTDLLDNNDILYQVEDSSPQSLLMPTSNQEPEIRVKLIQKDFERVNALLEVIAVSNLENIRKDHYLLEFSVEELMEILAKPDEWNKNDFVLAQKLLKDQGKEISPERIVELQKERIATLAKPEADQSGWIILGYVMAIAGSLLGIWMGWYLSTFAKTLPDGRRVFAYSTSDRKHGNRIFLLGIVFTILWLILILRLKKII